MSVEQECRAAIASEAAVAQSEVELECRRKWLEAELMYWTPFKFKSFANLDVPDWVIRRQITEYKDLEPRVLELSPERLVDEMSEAVARGWWKRYLKG